MAKMPISLSMWLSKVRQAPRSLDTQIHSAQHFAGTVFDVTHKRDTYGKGGSYNLFAGKDASKALGKSSLKQEDASPDYSDLDPSERKVLDDWHSFFE